MFCFRFRTSYDPSDVNWFYVIISQYDKHVQRRLSRYRHWDARIQEKEEEKLGKFSPMIYQFLTVRKINSLLLKRKVHRVGRNKSIKMRDTDQYLRKKLRCQSLMKLHYKSCMLDHHQNGLNRSIVKFSSKFILGLE